MAVHETVRPPRRIPRWRGAVGVVLATGAIMYGAHQWSTDAYVAGQARGLAYQRCVSETQDQVDCQRRLPLIGPAYAR